MQQKCIKKTLELLIVINCQTKLFVCVTTSLAHQVLDNVSLLVNRMFSFTVLETYFLLVVYSLYRELKGTAPPKRA
jgi:hypothetical protein